ncbi:MAG TPA: glycosyltransferase family 4 protein [Kofleriaceae bacterium]|nr:glycosyltransferase family 4 protein [Kofleriaceae bacterium]
MRIGVVTTSYPRAPGDAAGSFVAAHVEAMRSLGHAVDVIGAHTIHSPLFEKSGAPDELERGGVRAILDGAWFTARLTAAVTRRARDWDLVVAHWLAPSALAALPARKPLLAIAHGGDVHTLRRMHLLRPALRLLRNARLVFVSSELRDLAGVSDALVQPMGVDVDHFMALGRAPTTPPTIAVIGRLVPIKGVDVLLAALRDVRSDVRVVIAGDGPQRARLQRAAPPNVTFLGSVDAARRDQLLREASAVVIPSRVLPNGRSEGTPVVALEALATGVPLIASDVGGLRDLRGARRVSPENPGALAAAIDRVLVAPPSSAELRASVAELAWSRVAKRLLQHAGCEAGDTNRRRSA